MSSTRAARRQKSTVQPYFPAFLTQRAAQVILAFGMGIESSSILCRWLLDPTSRGFSLDDLTVVTAMVGDEFSDTGQLVTAHILPLLRRYNVRYVQVARGGPSFSDGYVVLDDSRQPTTLHLRGHYKLSDELLAAGTVPQVAHGKRICSAKHKGWVLDQWISANFNAVPYRHAIGFNRDEVKRIDRDNCYGEAGVRFPFHPLMEWNWSREDAWSYIMRTLNVSWKRSQCSFCCFSNGNPAVLERFRELPEAGLKALLIERLSLSLNERMTLYSSKSLYSCLRTDDNRALLDEFESTLDRIEYKLYRVRRVIHSRRVTHRKVEGIAAGSRSEMAEMLAHRAETEGIPLSHEADIPRLYLKRRAPGLYPDTEEMIVAAPALAVDKGRASFERSWARVAQQFYQVPSPVQIERSAAA